MAETQSTATNPDLNAFIKMRSEAGIPSPIELGKAAEAATKEKAASMGASAGQIKKGMAARNALAANIPAVPKAPKLETEISAAPQQQFRNPTEAFSSLGPVLAVFGSLLTRRPMVTAMKAASSAMEGFHKGDTEAYERDRQVWMDNMKKSLEQNKTELEQYHAAMEEHSGNMADMQAKMQAIAANNQDWHTLASLQAPGGAAAAFERMKMMDKAGNDLMKQFETHLKTQNKNNPTLSEDAINKFSDAIASGIKPSSLGLGYGNNPNKTAVLNRLAETHPDVDLAQVELDYGGKQQETRTVGASAGRIKLAANSLDRAIPLARDAATKVPLSEYPSLNALENAIAKGTGDPNIISLTTALNTVVSDYAALMVRSGVPTVESRNAAREMVNQNMASGQLDAFFDQIELEKGAQLQAIEDTRNTKPVVLRVKVKDPQGVPHMIDDSELEEALQHGWSK